MSLRASPTVVGAFVVVGVALAVVAVTLLGSGRLFRTTEVAVSYFDDSVSGLLVGAPVKLMGLDVGRVSDIRVDVPGAGETPGPPRVAVYMELDDERFAIGGKEIDLTEPDAVRRLVAEGLRARLGTESFVTGIRYVSLEFDPESPARLLTDGRGEHPEIPSIPGETEQLQAEATEVLAELADVDYEGTFRALRDVATDTSEVLESKELKQTLANLEQLTANLSEVSAALGPRGRIGRNLEDASEQSAETATAIRDVFDPEGALLAELQATLREVREAARSLRRLSNQLERDPASLIRGKP